MPISRRFKDITAAVARFAVDPESLRPWLVARSAGGNTLATGWLVVDPDNPARWVYTDHEPFARQVAGILATATKQGER